MIKFKNVSLGYDGKEVLGGVNLEIGRNDFIGIIGQNGSGKTTILKAITRLIMPVSGEIEWSADVNLGYVIQRQYLDTIFPLSVRDVVMMGRYGRIGPLKHPAAVDIRKSKEAMELTGISSLADRQYRLLSGGQRQRALIARALASEPNLLLLDEPTNDLDIKGEEQILQLIERLHDDTGITVVLVSHTLLTVLNYVHRIVLLKDGKMEVYPTEEIFTEERLSRIYDYPVKIGVIHNKRFVVPYKSGKNGNN